MKKTVVTILTIAIVVLALASVGPVLYAALTDNGVKTASLDEGQGEPATTDVNGTWTIIPGKGPNATSVGYTFHEVLPGKSKITSGSTSHVSGSLIVKDGSLTEGTVTVDMATLASDVEKRDIAVRRTILHTDDFPEGTFSITKPVDLRNIPDDGTVREVDVPGELTLHGKTEDVTATLKVMRTGDAVIVGGDVPINRADFGLTSPDFVAAKIDDKGEINLLLTLKKADS